MRREASGAATEASPVVDTGRTQLADVLASREFAERRTSTWMEDLRRGVADWILGLWRQMGGERLGRRTTAIILAWIAGIGALAVLPYWLVGAIVQTRPRAGL